MLKNILKIILMILVIVAVGLVVYWYFDRQQGGNGNFLSGNNMSIGDFFPFGRGGEEIMFPETGFQPEIPTVEVGQSDTAAPRLWQISRDPQSGAVVFNNGTSTVVRFTDRATGNVFESRVGFLGFNRVSNTTVPKVYEAKWQPNGDMVVLRHLNDTNDTIKSWYGRFSTSSATFNEIENGQTPLELERTPLLDNIKSLSINNENGSIAYLVENRNGSVVFLSDRDITNNREIFRSPIKDLEISWAGNSRISLLTKPNRTTSGFLYFLDISSGQIEKVLGDKIGLTTLVNNNGTQVVYSEIRSGSLVSGLFNTAENRSTELPFFVIPEKCVWSNSAPYLYCAIPATNPGSRFPDSWYRGESSFDDTIWRINPSNLSGELLIDPTIIADGGIDAMNLLLDPSESYLIFTNKKDQQLWGFRIVEES